jgi:hypothetical protein
MRNNIILGKCQCVFAMSLSPQTQRFEPLEEEECAEGVQAWAKVPKKLCAHFDSERDFAERLSKHNPVVPLSGGGEAGEFSRSCPVEFSLLNKGQCIT